MNKQHYWNVSRQKCDSQLYFQLGTSTVVTLCPVRVRIIKVTIVAMATSMAEVRNITLIEMFTFSNKARSFIRMSEIKVLDAS